MEYTVRHLIEDLLIFDPELPVETEGCDCNGDAKGVAFIQPYKGCPNGRVLVTRMSIKDYDNH